MLSSDLIAVSHNPLERALEFLAGYPIDWDATGTWAQLFAALIGLYAAFKISRAELEAQRAVAKENERQYIALVVGLARQAAADICTTASALQSVDMRDHVRGGEGPAIPSTATNVMTLRQLDLNRMPSAAMALAVVELRRLSGSGKNRRSAAYESWRENGGLSPDHCDALSEWAQSAKAALAIVEVDAAQLR